jgi:glycosyltransferase involved in cell wall biosynthesis
LNKIAIVLPDLRGGGAERQSVLLANDWAGQGIDVDLVLMRKVGEVLPLVSQDVGIVELGASRIRQAIYPLQKYLKHACPDVTLASMWPITSVSVLAWVLSGRQGKIFLCDHSLLSVTAIREPGLRPCILKGVIRATYPYASGLVAVSKAVKNDLCKLGGLSEQDVAVIYNPAASTDASSLRETVYMRNELWGENVGCRILTVGALKPVKNHDLLIRAFALLPRNLNARLCIVGEGRLREHIEELVTELGLGDRVLLPGYCNDPHPWFNTADLFVLTSRSEGFGNVIVEALEHGLPVVSTDCPGGPAEILEGGRYGTLVPLTDNPRELVTAITDALSTTHDKAVLINRAKVFALDSISRQYLDYFSST